MRFPKGNYCFSVRTLAISSHLEETLIHRANYPQTLKAV